MSLSSKLALGLGAKLDGNNFDTKKEDKKNPKKEEENSFSEKSTSISFFF